ncbi:hypothetical protein Hamer_G016391 [Homarus americanus]|uniref:Uncharacterized protein n=1 Tax=Homarus americanus TaxID=6706 RepID=A0A8J5THI4_HOMAM|nr:hypothetical protein Hamer_G016391 [Homarus americanus]
MREFYKSDYKEEMQAERKRMRKQVFDEGARDDTVSTKTASDRFRTQTFYPIVDKLIVQMGRRQEAYSVLCDRFGFLVDKSLSQDKVILKARNLVKTYSNDLEECFADEFLLFSNMYPEEKTIPDVKFMKLTYYCTSQGLWSENSDPLSLVAGTTVL